MIDLRTYGYIAAEYDEKPEGTPARVIAVHRQRYEVVSAYGESDAVLKTGSYYNGNQSFPATGDFVLIQPNPGGAAVILKTLKRNSVFSRNDFSGHAAGYVRTVLEQVVAANFDYVFIMASLNHDYNLRRVERYLTLAWQSGAQPVVALTKTDLVSDIAAPIDKMRHIAVGVPVLAVSAKTGYGLDAVREVLAPGKTAVFLGSSGVGKSSLVNALAGGEIMRVKEIRVDDGKGRHTTTHRQLILLPNGAMIIDTPGMRELGLWDADAGFISAFADVESVIGNCRFSDCGHRGEPGCAVKAALESGELPQERWKSYLALQREAKFVARKAGGEKRAGKQSARRMKEEAARDEWD